MLFQQILTAKGFKEAEDSFNASGPPWWDIGRNGSGSGIRIFVRQHSPKTKFRVGKGRGWTEEESRNPPGDDGSSPCRHHQTRKQLSVAAN
jgi:hypothetical protein